MTTQCREGTIRRGPFLQKLREMDFEFKAHGARMDTYKRTRDGQIILVRKKNCISEDYVLRTLLQHGQAREEAERFISAVR